MKTLGDTETVDMLPDGYPAFDLDPEHPWPMPPVKPWKPTPEAKKVLEPFQRWLAKMAVQ